MTNLTDMLSKFVNSNTASTSGSGTLPSNTITNPKVDLKGITTRSGVAYQGPMIPTTSSSPPKVVKRETEPVVAPVSAPKPNPKPSIPYPSRLNHQKIREKPNNQIEKFYQIFQDLHFKISFADALILMSKFASTLKSLIGNKENLSEMARTPLNEHCSAVLLKKLPKKHGDPGKFLIPYHFPRMDKCLALADIGASINLFRTSNISSLYGLKDQGSSVEIFGASSIKPISIMQKKERCGKKFTNPSILSLKTKSKSCTTYAGKEVSTLIVDPEYQPRLVIDLQSLNRPPNDSSIPNQHNSQNVTAITKQTTSLPPIPPQLQQGSSDSILIQRIGELEQHMADMVRKAVDEIVTDAVDWAIQAPLRDRFRDFPEADMKEILHHCMWESYPTIRIMKTTPFHKQLYEASRDKSMGARDLTDKLHNRFAEHENKEIKRHAFTENTTGLVHLSDTSPPPLAVSSSNSRQLLELVDVRCKSSSDEDIGHDHIPTVNLRQNWWKPLTEDRPATPEPAWSIPLSDLPVLVNNWASALTSTYAPPPENSLLAQTGQVTIQSDFFFNKDLEYLRYGRKSGRMVPIDMDLIEGMQVWDIAAMYGISHWWFQRQRFYIDRHTSEGDCRAVRTHIRILSVVRIEVFSLYGYDYMKTIVLPYQVTQLNLTNPRWDATSFEFNHDYTVIDSQRAVTFRDRYGVQMIMRFNEIHKFSNGTLQQIDEALDYRVKEFKVNRMNPGLNIRFWTRKDVDRSKEFMFTIQKRLKTRRIF
ncbi:hypothetical protein Tco_1038246 [Tanacetum coccineum]